MNCIPRLDSRALRLLAIAALAFMPGLSPTAGVQANSASPSALVYRIDYIVTPEPKSGGAWVELKLTQSSGLLRQVDMRAPAGRISRATGDGDIVRANERLVWNPPRDGGSLRWFALIDHLRNGRSYDALITSDWAIFRAEDVIPQAATRTVRGAKSATTLRFELPAGWSSVTEYFGDDDSYAVANPQRRYDRPAGWILLGDIGVRFDRIAGVRVNVAAPRNHGMRRNDVLAFLNWTLPEVIRVVPGFTDRLTIVGAGDPMWRGGLSGPRSLFLHADRPLISENSTSTLLHEILHVAMGRGAGDGMDWIVEGIAEYYSLTILHRSGTITDKRYADALQKQADWGASIEQLCVPVASGAVTARAVSIMHSLDSEIRKSSKKNLDDVLAAIIASGKRITLTDLANIVERITGSKPRSLRTGILPGCDR
ncbi:MAG: hypothetical protein R3192_03805 [Woeseiaceae bacterium]|nr:hypothetical protein [Woeseiaceae bacterium]